MNAMRVDRAELPVTLFGRAAECAHLNELLALARSGQSVTLVIRGDAGIGKSALLEFATGQAAGSRVLEIQGNAAEADLAFAGLFGLLRPILDKLETLSEPQSRALAAAFGLAESSSPDRFLVSAAAVSLIAAAAEETPLLCIVDDAQWLDQPSAEALVFVARRLHADAVAFVFAASEWEGVRFDAPGLPELVLAGLDPISAAEMLDETTGDLAPAVRERLLVEASGNPLALRELPRGLSKDELQGRDPLPEQIPLTPRLRRLFGQQIERLPVVAREALLVSALDGTGDVIVVLRAAAQLGLTADSLAPAETAGLLRTAGGKVAFAHPLVRAAVVDAAPLAQRQRVHAAFAETLSADDHVDRRVWHQAMAALTGDEDVASALEDSARRAQERGGHASAATAYQRAAELTIDETRLASRLNAAAQAAWNAGQIERARALIERALRFANDESRPRLLHLKGSIELAEGRARDGAETLLAAAKASTDPSTTLEILVDLVQAGLVAGYGDEFGIESIERAGALEPRSPRDAFNRSLLLWLSRRLERQFEESWPYYDEAMYVAAELSDDAYVQYQAALLSMMSFGPGSSLSLASGAVEVARSQGRVGLLPSLLAQLAAELAATGQFESAVAIADEGRQLALDTGQSPAWHLLVLARVEAIWGEAEAARSHLDEASVYGAGFVHAAAAGAVLALLELGCGRPEDAVEAMLAASPGERLAYAWTAGLPDLIEAIVRAGRSATEDTDALLARLRRSASRSRSMGSLVARCEALLGERPPAEAFEEALTLADQLSPFERARTELLYGEWLRRERRRTDARPHLRAAADEFRRLGARPWQARAEQELRASGETARKRNPSAIRELTPQERQVAQLAAEGFSNPEIAAQLFLSPRTIEYHLRKVFSKLGISGRTELVRRGIVDTAE